MSSKQLEPQIPLALYGLFGILLWLPVPFGSKPEWAVVLFATLTIGLAAIWLIAVAAGRYGLNMPFYKAWPFHAGFILIISWLWIQQLPLPLDLVAGLSPKTFEHYIDAYNAVGIALPERTPLSLDPYGTYLSFWLTLGYWLLFCLLLGIIKTRRQLIALAWVIVIAGAFQAAFGAFSILSDLETLLLAEKQSYKGVATGTFVNRNSFAGFLEMTLAVGIGLQISELGESNRFRFRDRLIQCLGTLLSNKIVLRTFLAVMVIGMIMSRSRMGNAAFFPALCWPVCCMSFVDENSPKALLFCLLACWPLILRLSVSGLALIRLLTVLSKHRWIMNHDLMWLS